MARQAASMKKTRTRYSQDYKAEAWRLPTVSASVLPPESLVSSPASSTSGGPRPSSSKVLHPASKGGLKF